MNHMLMISSTMETIFKMKVMTSKTLKSMVKKICWKIKPMKMMIAF